MNTKPLAIRLRLFAEAFTEGSPSYQLVHQAVARIEAAEALSTSSDARVGAKVSALVWDARDLDRPRPFYIVETGFGSTYKIWDYTRARVTDVHAAWEDPDGLYRKCASVDEAKAAAQSDFETRILSALAPASSGEREEPTGALPLKDQYLFEGFTPPASPEKDEPVAWFTLDTAPRDGTPILITGPDKKTAVVASWVHGQWKLSDYKGTVEFWRPLFLFTAPPSLADAVAALKEIVNGAPSPTRVARATLAKIEGGRS